MRRHGWQLPLHPLQMVGVVVFSFLVVCFYVFLGPFLGNRIATNTVLTLFSFTAFSASLLFVRCTAIDPSDRTYRDKKRKAGKNGGIGRSRKLNYKFIIFQIAVRFIRKMEYWILRSCIRRRYLDPWKTAAPPIEPLLPFPLVNTEDAVAPHLKDNDISFCPLCDFEVKLHSKHCRSCDRCVDGFDHHCRWLNNCIGKRNYTTFILLLVFILLMLAIEGGTAIAIFVRCFADREGIASEIKQNLHTKMPIGVLIAISVLLATLTAYTCAALGQLFFFHVVLIRKGMRTYDYILAMREEGQSFDPFDDLDLSSSDDESVDFDLPEKPSFLSRFLCKKRREKDPITRRLSIKIDDSNPPNAHKKKELRIDPWRLIMMSKEKAVIAVERARETIIRQKTTAAAPPGAAGGLSLSPMKPIPSEAKGPLMTNKAEKKNTAAASEMTPVSQKCWFPGSPRGWFSSPRARRRFSGSPSPKQQRYKNNFDLKLTEVSRELETYISKQVLCSVLQKGKEDEASPPR